MHSQPASRPDRPLEPATVSGRSEWVALLLGIALLTVVSQAQGVRGSGGGASGSAESPELASLPAMPPRGSYRQAARAPRVPVLPVSRRGPEASSVVASCEEADLDGCPPPSASEALGMQVSADFLEVPVEWILRCFELEAGRPFLLEREVSRRLRREAPKGSLQCQDRFLASALDALLEPLSIAVAIRDGEILLVNRRRVSSDEPASTLEDLGRHTTSKTRGAGAPPSSRRPQLAGQRSSMGEHDRDAPTTDRPSTPSEPSAGAAKSQASPAAPATR